MPILDTDIIIALIKGDESALEHIRSIEASPTLGKFTTSISAFELFNGAYRLMIKHKNDKDLDFVKEFLSGVDEVFQFDYEASEIAGRIMSELSSKGSAIDIEDVMIAAIAIRRNEPVVTRNTKHFSGIEGLIVQPW